MWTVLPIFRRYMLTSSSGYEWILSRVGVTYKTRFGLDDWISSSLLVQSLVITINYNNSQQIFSWTLLPWLPRTPSIPTGLPLLLASNVLPKTTYNHFTRTPRETPSSAVQNARLPVRYLAMDVLLLSACVAGIFTDPLPSNGYTTSIYNISDFRSSRFDIHIDDFFASCVSGQCCRHFVFHLGGSVYFRDAKNTAEIHTVKIPSTESTSS
jgi:hypothetical protein